ncbi:hypothetical protein JTE90_000896 [Oedothorax gibbosus]|uniref:C2H2-type domain-containing protein n=1 Tax=Oedothorax gibbosus TaxID=931172 RepID=A0AAV6VT23_9ARAC|nr:hypothetical protein JTE90_000896 [Oedothorax gibbosus]
MYQTSFGAILIQGLKPYESLQEEEVYPDLKEVTPKKHTVKNHACDICDKAFTSRQNLKKHLLSHSTSMKPYSSLQDVEVYPGLKEVTPQN